ncbi:MAG: carbon monoxide dehydrogenase [Candidatus Zixiibacteriota bacterium]|nr:MAG: carbon monoxide dehydrogenase [candidate division Zixibacteria bacterium]
MTSSPCVAVVGKGGVGKTTLAAFTLRRLLERSVKPLLAIDADPSSCLASVLGVDVGDTIGGIREDTRAAAKGIPEGIPKQQYLEMRVQQAVTEAAGFDFLSMGRPEGPGCYCFVNNVLREHLDRLTRSYRATVIDCEAGLEHLSRRTTQNVDAMILTADPTVKALETVRTVLEIAERLDSRVKRKLLVVNRVPPGAEDRVMEAVRRRLDLAAFEAVAMIPQDSAIFEAELAGQSLLEIETDIPSYRAYTQFLDGLTKSLV